MSKSINLIGKTFGSLIVIDIAPREKGGRLLWLCQCECGNTIKVPASSLNSGRTQSCGCKKQKATRNSILVAYQGFVCKYPDEVCETNKLGVCCRYCKVGSCVSRCKNDYTKCGSRI